MEWVVVLVAVVVLLVVADRLTARGVFDRFLDRPRVEREGSSTVGGLFDALGDVFQPNRELLTAEKERQRLDIHYTGDDAPPFDLESGTVVLPPTTRHPDERHVPPTAR
ncbi:DUF6191 domain-containing protein [Cellulomonas persica]|uniref:Uncharacterized protein n=1 Tax=Cellulomonas persica TaxID=76861 RepID=A0A510UTC1_9CELL|nr:DUF6191 domain-containing protein [Cellulomonas persica]GEK17746.1 hypothetical protein CPE01_14790 [Cellulomonas persica]